MMARTPEPLTLRLIGTEIARGVDALLPYDYRVLDDCPHWLPWRQPHVTMLDMTDDLRLTVDAFTQQFVLPASFALATYLQRHRLTQFAPSQTLGSRSDQDTCHVQAPRGLPLRIVRQFTRTRGVTISIDLLGLASPQP
jgi:hypothetical protein